jgi:DNA-binding CsgD family transcriptional regulator
LRPDDDGQALSIHEQILRDRGVEFVVWGEAQRETFRTRGATALLQRWFTPEEPWSLGLPEVLGGRLAELSRSDPDGAFNDDGLERHGPARVLRVSFTRVDGWCVAVLEELPLPRALPGAWIERLTAREVEVTRHLLEGWDNQLIADELGCSVATVKKHLQRVFDKLGLSSRASLLAVAARTRAEEVGSTPPVSHPKAA